jgi:hypothetical protein
MGIKTLAIPAGTAAIGGLAELLRAGGLPRSRDEIEEVDIPGSVREIGPEAFDSWGALRRVRLHEGLEKIGARAFWFCRSLREITFPASVQNIGPRAFECCHSLSAITMLNPGTAVDEYAFNETPYFNKLMKDADEIAAGKNAAVLTLPEGLTHIDLWAFSGCGIVSAVLPNSLRTIGMCAFKGCKNLREVSLSPNTYCNYKLPLESGDGIFAGCSSLEQVTFRGRLKDFTWYDADAPELLKGFDRNRTFSGCPRLRRIIAPELPLEAIPRQWRQWAINGYICDVDREGHYAAEVCGSYDRELAANPGELLSRTAAGYPAYHYMIRRRMIDAGNYDTLLAQARDGGDAVTIAAMLEYGHKYLRGGTGSLDRAMEELSA